MFDLEKGFELFKGIKTELFDKRLVVENGSKKYIFNNSILPTEIEIDGENILAKPVCLNMEFVEPCGDGDNVYFRIIEKNNEKSVIIASTVCGNVIINSTITAELDGFIKIDLKFSSFWAYSAEKTPKLDKMNISIEIKEKYSKLFHYWPNDRHSIIPSQKVVNSGTTLDAEFMFKPYVWAGNNREGLGLYFGDTTEPFLLKDGDKCIVVKKNSDTTSIVLNMLDEMPDNWKERDDDWCDTLKPVFFTIGFQATPVEKDLMLPKDEYYRRVHIGGNEIYDDNIIEKICKRGAKWVIIHEDWTAIQNYGLPHDEELLKKRVELCHKKGIKVMSYFGYEYSTLMPDFTEKCDEYLIKNTNGNFTGGWQRKPHQRAFMVCYNGGYSEDMLNRVKYVMDELGIDGIYTDGTYMPWECANESHGCGYIDRFKRLCPTYPFMAVRKHVKEMYRIVHERGGIIDAHNSSCCIMPLLAFADSCYDGENIQSSFKAGGIDFLSLDGFRAEFMGINYGFVPNFIAYTSEGYTFEKISALTLLHNVHSRPSKFQSTRSTAGDVDSASAIWDIFKKYSLDEKKWVPYFENGEMIAEENKVYVSLYKGEGETVALISGFADDSSSATVTANGYNSAYDIIEGKAYEIENGKVKLDIIPNSPRFFLFK